MPTELHMDILKTFARLTEYFNHAEIKKHRRYPFIINDTAYLTNGGMILRYPNRHLKLHKVKFEHPTGKNLDTIFYDNMNTVSTVEINLKKFQDYRKDHPCNFCIGTLPDCPRCFGTNIMMLTPVYNLESIDTLYDIHVLYFVLRLFRVKRFQLTGNGFLKFQFGRGNHGTGLILPIIENIKEG